MLVRSSQLHDLHELFIVTIVIVGIGLWRSRAENLTIVHNCLHWGALHIMNVGEKGEV